MRFKRIVLTAICLLLLNVSVHTVNADGDDNQLKGILAKDVAFEYHILNDWKQGATVQLKITNDGLKDIDGWNIEWVFPGNQKIENLWCGTYSQEGNKVEVKNEPSDSKIVAKGYITIGFNISYSGINLKPNEFKLFLDEESVTSNEPLPPLAISCPQPITAQLITDHNIKTTELRIGTYNLEGWRKHDPYAQAKAIKDTKISILCIQEGSDFDAGGKLERALGVAWERKGDYYIDRSKYSFEYVTIKNISHKRYIYHSILKNKQSGERIGVLNTHWDEKRGWQNDQNLKEAQEFLRDFVKKNNNIPTVIVGDFNRYPKDDMFPEFKLAIRGKVHGSVDGIYYRGMNKKETGITSALSDHDLVFAELYFD